MTDIESFLETQNSLAIRESVGGNLRDDLVDLLELISQFVGRIDSVVI